MRTRDNLNQIYILEPNGDAGYLSVYDQGVSYALSRNGYDVSLFSSSISKNTNPRDEFKIYEIFKKSFNKRINKLFRGFYYIAALKKFFVNHKAYKVDLIYYHIFTYSVEELLTLLSLIFFARKKVVINIHDMHSLEAGSNFLHKIILFFLKAKKFEISSHSHSVKESLINKYSFDNCIIMPHSDVDIFFRCKDSKESLLQKFNLPKNKKYFLFFGKIKKSKGLDILLKAWSNICKEYPDYSLLIVGSSANEDILKYRDIIKNVGIENSCIWIEKSVPDQDAHSYFKIAEASILPYKEVYSSGVLLRSLGYNTPMILSNIKNFKTVLDDSECFYFDIKNPKNLHECIKTFIDNPGLVEDKRHNANTALEKKYNWDKIGKDMSLILDEILTS